jgi:hypothetical protein
MDPKQYNKWISRAIKTVGDVGYKVAGIKIDTATWDGKGGLNSASYLIDTRNSMGHVIYLTVNCEKGKCEVKDFFPKL